MHRSRYRRRLDIIASVLSAAGESARKTRIRLRANLGYDGVSRYLAEVSKAGLVSMDDGRFYSLTDKGKEFMRRYGEYSSVKNSTEALRADLERLCSGNVPDEAPKGTPFTLAGSRSSLARVERPLSPATSKG